MKLNSHAVRWVGLVVTLLGVNALIGGTLVFLAHSDPAFAVEKDYYDKALAWDETARARAESEALGWRADVTVGDPAGPLLEQRVAITLTDDAGAPVEGAAVSAEFFHAARSNDRRNARFSEESAGVYVATDRLTKPGLWDFHIEAELGDDRFVAEAHTDVRDAGSGSP